MYVVRVPEYARQLALFDLLHINDSHMNFNLCQLPRTYYCKKSTLMGQRVNFVFLRLITKNCFIFAILQSQKVLILQINILLFFRAPVEKFRNQKNDHSAHKIKKHEMLAEICGHNSFKYFDLFSTHFLFNVMPINLH